VQRKLQVTPKTLNKAAREVIDMAAKPRRWSRVFAWPSLVLAAACAGGVFATSLLPLPFWPISWPKAELAAAPAAPAAEVVQSPPASAGAAEAAVPPEQVALASVGQPVIEEPRWTDATLPLGRSEELAFQDLFNLYGIAYDPRGKGSACKVAEAVDMRCLYARGGVSDLLQANQPAMLLMDGAGKGGPSYAVLTALDGESATVIVAGARHRVALAQLAPLWSGKYALLWHAPPGFSSVLAGGSRGPAVSWLRQSLARVQGENADGPAVFDNNLVGRVKAFQLAEGMAPDGVAGALTLIRLNLRLDWNLPRLSKTVLGGLNVLHP
jgi:general secretion pathway protein A